MFNWFKVKKENERLRKENLRLSSVARDRYEVIQDRNDTIKQLGDVKIFCDNLGIKMDSVSLSRQLKNRIDIVKDLFPKGVMQIMTKLKGDIYMFEKQMKQEITKLDEYIVEPNNTNLVDKQAKKEERERCAKICEDIYKGAYAPGDWPTPEQCAAAIRKEG